MLEFVPAFAALRISAGRYCAGGNIFTFTSPLILNHRLRRVIAFWIRCTACFAAILTAESVSLAQEWVATLQTSGRYQAAQIRDTIVYAASGWGFETFAIHGDGSVEQLASIPSVGTTVDIRIDNRYAYVFDEGVGILIYDCLEPTAPLQTAIISQELADANYSFVGDMLLVDSILFVAFINNAQGVYLYDIADPSNPFLLEKYQFSPSPDPDSLTRAYVLTRRDSLLFVVDPLGIWVASISNPAQPQRIGCYRSSDWPVTSTSAAVVGDRLVVTDDHAYQSYDISDLSAPVPTVYQLLRQDIGDWPNQVLAIDSFLLVPVGRYGVKTVRVPPDPRDSLELADLYEPPHLATHIAVDDSLAVICDLHHGFGVASVSGAAILDSLGYFPSGFGVGRLIRVDYFLFSRNAEYATIFDIANPRQPSIAGGIQFANLWHMQVVGQNLYASDIVDLQAGTTYLEVFALADTAHPLSVGRFQIPTRGGESFEVRGAYSYHADTKFSILRIEDPDSIALVGQVPGAWSRGGNVVLWNEYAYCTYGPRLYIVDISDVTAPDVLNPAGLSYPYTLAIAEDSLLYEADESVLRILSLADPLNPVALSETPLSGVQQMRKRHNYLYVAAGTVQILDVSDPFSPHVEAVFTTPGAALGIDLDDSLLYVGDADGLTVLRYQTPSGVFDDRRPSRPLDFTLNQNIPNPFNAATELRFQLSKPGRALLQIHNVLGRLVHTRDLGDLDVGSHRVIVAQDQLSGHGGASGVYFYTLRIDGQKQSRKMLLLK